MTRIVVAEDDELQASLLERYLSREGYEVTVVSSGTAALDEVRRATPHLLVLDVMLPGMDGLTVSRKLRDEHDLTPVLMLTARATENDMLLGLELGADDYIFKPYSPRELVARVRALLRRTRQDDSATTIEVGELTIDPRRRTVRVRGNDVALTRAEFDLLEELAVHRDAVLSRSQLLTRLHGSDIYITGRTIDAHVKNLRLKIEVDTRNPVLLVTVYGVGYKLVGL
ncbi:response regulator transcription factor [Lacisediminihabitans sp. FW035]